MMQRVANIWAAVSLAALILMLIVGLAMWSHGFDSRAEPSNMESSIAMKLHDSSTPSRYEKMTNPLTARGVDLIEAGGHYEEHCAACHGDDGGGTPKFHGLMYPRPTDLRSEDTQEMSDGELYWVIKNGIRWSGMPAFGKPGDEDEHVWKMVAYVRHLTKLTPAEEQQVLEKTGEPMDHGESTHDQTH